ncbi:MAG TPA: Fur family transcriptional regulator [Anaerolineae bacterium]|nr:Fur family transcriptional regulator [Anaerolineae bacterium]HQK15479.1 Fur family transcriptional regulator [Anaerolineae bacterium]
MPTLETLIELFRRNGRKMTPQRRAILALLTQGDAHPTAEQIYQQISATMPDVSRATVYNTLRELVALGGLSETFEYGEGGLHYDLNASAHHHLFCIRCHALADVHHDFAELTLPPEKTAGYQIKHYQVIFYGLCPTCQKLEAGEKLSTESTVLAGS